MIKYFVKFCWADNDKESFGVKISFKISKLVEI